MVGSESSSFFLALRFSRVNNGSLQEVGTAQHPSGGGRPSPENISSDESSTLAEHHIAFLPCAGAGAGGWWEAGSTHWRVISTAAPSSFCKGQIRAVTRGKNTRKWMIKILVFPAPILFHQDSWLLLYRSLETGQLSAQRAMIMPQIYDQA